MSRFLWTVAAFLLVFAQVAVAADVCLPELAGSHQTSVSVVLDVDHGLHSHCAEAGVPSNQAPAPEVKRPAPDMGVPIHAAWSSAPGVSATHRSHEASRAGPSLPLQFRNLRL